MNMRYAIYFAPPQTSSWGRFGAKWLGRDAILAEPVKPYRVPGFSAAEIERLTGEPRRYGFHATLKAPIRLAPGASRAGFLDAVQLVADRIEAVPLGAVTVGRLGSFLALLPVQPPARLRDLAALCVRELDAWRAAPTSVELARRRKAPLSHTEEAMLARWGYPYVLEHWRFHMTLTGAVPQEWMEPLQCWLERKVDAVGGETMVVDSLCVFEQAASDAEFRMTERIALRKPLVPPVIRGTPGRLYYVVGPSGSGKDSLISYARQQLCGRPIVFARRFIDRPVQPGPETHVALSNSDFQRQLRRGEFAMYWRANGYQYGIGTDIDGWLARGRDVVVNGSREYIDRARARYPELRLVWIETDASVLRKRLLERGRDDPSEIARRLLRAESFVPPEDALIIHNSGPLVDAGERLIEALTRGAPARI